VSFQYSPIFDVVRGLRAPAFSDQVYQQTLGAIQFVQTLGFATFVQ